LLHRAEALGVLADAGKCDGSQQRVVAKLCRRMRDRAQALDGECAKCRDPDEGRAKAGDEFDRSSTVPSGK
jgi:hypothetical protein